MARQTPAPIAWARDNRKAAALIGALLIIIVGLIAAMTVRDSGTTSDSPSESAQQDPYAPDTLSPVRCDNFSEYIVNESTQDELCELLGQSHPGDQTLLGLMRQDGPYLDYTGLSASEQVALAKYGVQLLEQGWNESDLTNSMELGFGLDRTDALSLVIQAEFVYSRPTN